MQNILQHIAKGDIKTLARAISIIENEVEGYNELLIALPPKPDTKLLGITGAPGAGKSTLVDALINKLVQQNKTIGVLCVDPSSPFNLGALLGDRIRMSRWYNHPSVFIRSLATRGSMGGLHPKIIEITDLMKAAPFDFIVVETVGVGQTEVEIAGLADTTVVVVVPESGDEVQTMKAGLMEIADIFVVNKADRPDADMFVKNLRQMLAPAFSNHSYEIPVVKTVASEGKGIAELLEKINKHEGNNRDNHYWLLTEKAYQLIQYRRMKDIDKSRLFEQIRSLQVENIYTFLQSNNWFSS